MRWRVSASSVSGILIPSDGLPHCWCKGGFDRLRPHSKLRPSASIFSGIIFSDGDVWRQHRQFAATTLRDMGFGRSILEPRIKEEVEYLIREISQTGGCTFDIEKMVENAVSNIICVMLFGRRYDYRDPKFRNLLDALKLRANLSSVGFLSPFILSPWLGKMMTFTPLVSVLSAGRTLHANMLAPCACRRHEAAASMANTVSVNSILKH